MPSFSTYASLHLQHSRFLIVSCQKLTKRTFTALTGEKAKDDGEEEGEDGEPKKKAPNMHKILTKKLTKLCDKKADKCVLDGCCVLRLLISLPSGALLSEVFMDLPDKKQWAVYYKAIAKPMCFSKIFVRRLCVAQ
jgi:chromatin structure-remodeling complex subunit RSC4